MPRKAYAMDLAHLIELYESGLSEKACSESLGVSRGFVHSQLIKADVTLRTVREQLLIVASQRTPERRAEMAEAAHAAWSGANQRPESLARMAASRQRTAKVAPNEAQFAEWLAERGLRDIRHQTAIGRYNADLTTSTIAVEIFGGNWHGSGDHARRYPARGDYILDQGWHLVIVWDQSRSPLSIHAADYVVAFAKSADRNPTTPREYRVIRGCGEELFRGETHFDERALKPSQRNASR